MSRALAVMRMHLIDRVTLVVLPWAIVAASFLINLALWLTIDDGQRQTGGASALFVFVLAAAVFAVVRGMPFALGMGATRRAFVGGTTLTGVVLALAFGTVFTLLSAIEKATSGWGLHGNFFWFSWFAHGSWVSLWLMLVLGVTASFAIGQATASVYSRWSSIGLAVGGPLVVLVLGGFAVLASWREWWGGIGHWFADLTPLATAGWLLLLTAVLSGASWLVLRRVTL